MKKKFFSKVWDKFNKNELPFPMVIYLLVWRVIDVFRYIKNFRKDDLRLYGIYGYFGLWGQGKTIGMTKELYDLRSKYKDRVYIFTNYGFKLEDKPFSNWEMLLDEYDKPAVFAWDEVQNEFSSRDYKNFPVQLLTILTQNRKGNGKRILYTAQRWARVDKVFRELTLYCYECKTRFSRLTSLRAYHWEEYEQLVDTSNVDSKVKIKSQHRKIFVQSDYLRSLYDSYQMLKSAKEKTYLDREELKKVSN